MVKVAPWPSALSTSSLPWWASTMLCEMERPSPTPDGSSLVVKKGSKIRSRMPAGLGALLIAERAKVGDDAGDPPCLLLQRPELVLVRRSGQLLAEEGGDSGERRDRIVQLVRHPRAQRTQRGETARAQDLVLRR